MELQWGEFMNKKKYVRPETTIVTFNTIDVLLSSGNKGYQSDPYTNNPFEGETK